MPRVLQQLCRGVARRSCRLTAGACAAAAVLASVVLTPGVFAASSANATAHTAARSGPELTLSTRALDFGVQKRIKEELLGAVSFTNTGDAPLIIEKITTSCGCTTANTDDIVNRPFAPGESGEIAIRFRPNKVGAQTKVVSVLWNSPGPSRAARISVSADVQPLATLRTTFATFRNMATNDAKPAQLLIRSKDPTFEIVGLDLPEHAHFSWSYVEGTDPNEPERIRRNFEPDEQFPAVGRVLITPTQPLPIGRYSAKGELVVRAGMPGEAKEEVRLDISILANVSGLVHAPRPVIRMATVEPGARASGATTLAAHDPETDWSIQRVELFDADPNEPVTDLQATWTPGDEPGEIDLSISVATPEIDAKNGMFRGEIWVWTDLPDHGPIPVQFGGVMRREAP